MQDVSLVVIRPEAMAREDEIVHWLSKNGYKILEQTKRADWREIVPRLYTYGASRDVPEDVLDKFLAAHDLAALPNTCEALLVTHMRGGTMERVVDSVGTAKNYQEGTLRKLVAVPSVGGWDFPGIHKPSDTRSLASHVRLFFGQAAVEKYL